jgi:hypothetical protein
VMAAAIIIGTIAVEILIGVGAWAQRSLAS